MNRQSAEAIISVLSFLMAYIIAVAPAGLFRAWVAKKMGDNTAEELGFLTLNPVVHIDPFGLFFLVLFNFGWGRYIPINPFNISRPYRILKLLCAYFSEVFIYFTSAVLGLTILIGMFGIRIIALAKPMILYRVLLQSQLTNMFPDSSSFTIAIGQILISYICINVMLAVLDFIINGFGFVMLIISDGHDSPWQYNSFLFFAIPMLLILFFAFRLKMIVIQIISLIGYLIASLLNLV